MPEPALEVSDLHVLAMYFGHDTTGAEEVSRE